jgi:hypothetical protein
MKAVKSHTAGKHHNLTRSARNKDRGVYTKQALRTAANKRRNIFKAEALKKAADARKVEACVTPSA